MSLFSIPTSQTDTVYRQVTLLDGREYVLAFDWSARESEWYLSIFDQDENPLALGIKVVVGLPLLYRETNPALPPGLLAAIDLARGDLDPAVDDFGTRVLLLYQEAEA
jgi:hypothetical protein